MKPVAFAAPHRHGAERLTLDGLPLNARATVHAVRDTGPAGAALRRRLMELGFVPGEQVQVMRRGLGRQAPMAVRVGVSTFAMRPYESSMVEVSLG